MPQEKKRKETFENPKATTSKKMQHQQSKEIMKMKMKSLKKLCIVTWTP